MGRFRGWLATFAAVAAALVFAGPAMANHMTAQGLDAGAFVPWGFNDDWFQCAGTTTCQEIATAGATQPAGLSTARFKIQWQLVQPSGPSNWNWTHTDDMYAAMQAEGMDPVMEIASTPAWARTSTAAIAPPLPQFYGEYREFVRRTVERYADGVAAIEIWNEPNHPGHWQNPNPDTYVALLEQARQAVDSANLTGPTPPVLFGGLAAGHPTNGIDSKAFLEQAYDSTAAADPAANFDGIAIHPYPFPPAPSAGPPASPTAWVNAMWEHNPAQGLTGDIDRIEAVRDAKDPGSNACLWITEVGVPATWAGFFWPVHQSWGATLATPTEQDQGPILAHLYASLYDHPCIKSFIIHNFNFVGEHPRWSAMHLMRPQAYGGGPRPALCYLAQRIGNPVC